MMIERRKKRKKTSALKSRVDKGGRVEQRKKRTADGTAAAVGCMRQPGIEPGANEWEPFILPLNH